MLHAGRCCLGWMFVVAAAVTPAAAAGVDEGLWTIGSGAVLDGDQLFRFWSSNVVETPAIVAYDLSRETVLWKYDRDLTYRRAFQGGPRLYLSRSCLIHLGDSANREVTWHDRQTGEIRRQVPGFGWPYGDRVVIGKLICDLETGEQLGEFSEQSRNTFRRPHIFLDCVLREVDGVPQVQLREWDRTSGAVIRTIPLPFDVDPADPQADIKIEILFADPQRVLLWNYSRLEAVHLLLLDLTSGTMLLDERAAHTYSISSRSGDVLLLRSFARTDQGVESFTIEALDLASGRWLWKLPPLPQLLQRPRVPVLLRAADGSLTPLADRSGSSSLRPLVVNLEDGSLVDNFPATALERLAWTIGPFQGLEVRHYGAVSAGYRRAPEETLYGWNAETGTLAWTHQPAMGPSAFWVTDFADEPKHIVLAADSRVFVIDPQTGEVTADLDSVAMGLSYRRSVDPTVAPGGPKDVPRAGTDDDWKWYAKQFALPAVFVVALGMAWLWARNHRAPTERQPGR